MANVGVDIAVRVIGGGTVTRDLRAIGTSSEKAADGIKTLQVAAQRARFELIRAFGLLAVAGAIKGSIGVLAKFSDSMAAIKASTRATGAAFESLRAKAMELGATTVFTASESADAILALAKAGLSIPNILVTVGPALNLARAGALGLAEATSILVDTLGQFSLAGNMAGRVSDVLAKGANLANLTVSDLSQSLINVGPLANKAGVSLEGTVALLGVLAQGGVRGGKAGTGLKNVLSNIVNATGSRTLDELRKLGLTLKDLKTSGNGLIETLAKMSDIDLSAAFKLFKKLGAPAFVQLSTNILTIKKFKQALLEATGFSKESAKIMDNSLGAALLRVSSAYEHLILTINGTSVFSTIFNGITSSILFLANNLDTAGVFALTLAGTLSSGVILRVVRVIFGISKGVGFLTIALKTATFAARMLARSLIIGIIIEGIVLSIKQIGDLNDKMRETIRLKEGLAKNDKVSLTPMQILKNVNIGVARAIVSIAKAVVGVSAAIVSGIAASLAYLGGAILKISSNLTSIIESLMLNMVHKIKGEINNLLNVVNKIPGVNIKHIDTSRVPSSTSLNVLKGVNNAGENAAGPLVKAAKNDLNFAFNYDPVAALKDKQDRAAAKLKDKRDRIAATLKVNVDKAAAESLKKKAKAQNDVSIATRDYITRLKQSIEVSRLSAIAKKTQIQINSLVTNSIKIGAPIEGEQLTSLKARTLAANILIDVNTRYAQIVRGGVKQAIVELTQSTKALNMAMADGSITATAYAILLERIKIKAMSADKTFSGRIKLSLAQLSLQMHDLGTLAGNSIVHGFNNAENALVSFVTTGKLSFKSLINSMIADMARLLIRRAFIAPLVGAFGNLFGNLFGSGGAISNFSASATGGAFSAPVGPDLGFTPVTSGFAHGASFMVGGVGGTDSQLVQFKASPNERVTIETPGQRGANRGGGGVTIINNIDAKGAEIGVEEKIVNAIANAAPLIINKARGASLSDTTELLTRRRL